MSSTTKRSNLSIIREVYKSLNEGNVENVLMHLDTDVTWSELEGMVLGGHYRGPDEVRDEVLTRLGDEFVDFTVDVDDYLDCGDKATIVGRLKGTALSGSTLDVPFAHVWELEDGLITSYQGFTDTALWNEALEM